MRWLTLALLLFVCPALAQDQTVVTGGCTPGTDFEAAGFRIRTVRVENPFEFLPWIAPAVRQARSRMAHLQGVPYVKQDIRRAEDEVSSVGFLPDAPDQRLILKLLTTTVENCSANQLDLTFWMLSSQIAPVLSGTLESATKEQTSPQTSAGADAIKNRLQIFPAAGYNRTDRLYGGGSLEYTANMGSFPLGRLRAEGVASTSMHKMDVALSGAHDSDTGWLAHTQWELNYQSHSEPSLDSRLGQNRLAAQFSAVSRTPVLMRFGGSLEGGNLQSTVPASVPMASGTVTGSGYGSLKFFLGTTGRWQQTGDQSLGKAVPFNVYSASYGVELGSTDPASSLSWIKHIADLADDLILPFGDHRWVELESRLTAGYIQVRGTIPQPARFFGGNRITPFISGEDWTISSNPFIRSIPANRLAATSAGFGGTRFISFNSTASLATWRIPLVPSEVTNDEGFRQQLGTLFDPYMNVLDVGYRTDDRHYKNMVSNLDKVQPALATLKEAVTKAQAAATPETAGLFQQCLRPIGRATVRVKSAQQDTGEAQYGDVAALLGGEPNQPPDPTENWLNKIHEACVNQLNAQVSDTAIAASAKALDDLHTIMEAEFSAIDRTASHNRAKTEMVYPKATLNTLLYQVNLLSVSPVLVFDVAHLGPANSELGTRYGVGGGVRLDLVSHVTISLGYAFNPKRLPNEGKGAFFFSMELKNLFE